MRGLKNKRVNIVYTYIIQKTKIFFKKKIRKKFINQKVKKQGNARLYSERNRVDRSNNQEGRAQK